MNNKHRGCHQSNWKVECFKVILVGSRMVEEIDLGPKNRLIVFSGQITRLQLIFSFDLRSWHYHVTCQGNCLLGQSSIEMFSNNRTLNSCLQFRTQFSYYCCCYHWATPTGSSCESNMYINHTCVWSRMRCNFRNTTFS